LTIVFLCSIEDKLKHDYLLPDVYRRYVDDNFAIMDNRQAAEDFLRDQNLTNNPTLSERKFSLNLFVY